MRLKRRVVPATTDNITKGIIGYICSLKNCHAWRIHTTGIYDPVKKTWRRRGKNERGIADVVACINGRFMSIEVKNQDTKDRMRKEQKIFKKKVLDSNGIHFVIERYPIFVAMFQELFPGLTGTKPDPNC